MITDNVIRDNESAFEHGCGIRLSFKSHAIIINNLIHGNVNTHASGRGGGIYVGKKSTPEIINNTIALNACSGATGKGGGIACEEEASAVIDNTIIRDNAAPLGEELWLGGSAQVSLSHCSLRDAQNAIVVESGGALQWKGGCIFSDPRFIDPATGDFSLSRRSPCINRGDDDKAPDHDIDGDPRPFMGSSDMGADEFVGVHLLANDAFTLSEVTGGILHFDLDGGIENKGRYYPILGSMSGTAPGTPLPGGGEMLHLNWDAFTNEVAHANYPDSIQFTGFFDILDGMGQGKATFGGTGPATGLAGQTL